MVNEIVISFIYVLYKIYTHLQNLLQVTKSYVKYYFYNFYVKLF